MIKKPYCEKHCGISIVRTKHRCDIRFITGLKKSFGKRLSPRTTSERNKGALSIFNVLRNVGWCELEGDKIPTIRIVIFPIHLVNDLKSNVHIVIGATSMATQHDVFTGGNLPCQEIQHIFLLHQAVKMNAKAKFF